MAIEHVLLGYFIGYAGAPGVDVSIRYFLTAEEQEGQHGCSNSKGGAMSCCVWRESQWMPAFRICLGAHLAWTILLFMHMRLMLVLEFVMSWWESG